MHAVTISFPLIPYLPTAFSGSTLCATRSSYWDCGCGSFECTWLALLQCTDGAGNLIALPLCKPSPSSTDESLLVGTRKDVCMDCKRYFRIWGLLYASVRAMGTDIFITSLIIRRIPLDQGLSSAAPLRIRRILIQSWCKAMLDAQGYELSLHRETVDVHTHDHVLTLRLKGSAGAAPSLIPRMEEIEVHIAQGDRTNGPCAPPL
ncbi:uncharacterized protein TRAVEDRAFT_50807 [Trametes versicolor FP-101664 SS1]|uniref:uncharacterized protein n=1 Tax=Trametes versicolor (strain FP-101664) TaxID=717944 RepID=UPI0004621646|nr:uncharacterized protein TRAVEDRAFT_50807 [Trametes versicolor FP-101664 SS1]EIW54669.1 hypothetical protein TRAVEDRAFT_50807 [Trametes versicolor FP-101664 SS1]